MAGAPIDRIRDAARSPPLLQPDAGNHLIVRRPFKWL